MSKGFKWNKNVIKATNQILVKSAIGYVIYGGNLFMELILPNALKLDKFQKLKVRLDKYVKSHNGKYPQQITVNQRQMNEYDSLFPKYPIADYRNKKQIWAYQGITMKLNNAKPRTKSRRLLNP